MRVLYVDHTTRVSGAERSLLELLRGLADDVEPILACPPGPLVTEARAAGARHVRVPATAASLKPHLVHTPRALAELAAMALSIRRAAQRERVDLIHANTLVAGLPAALARRLGGPPLVVHVRDCLPDSRAGRVVRRWIRSSADELIAISRFTADCFGAPDAAVIANAVDLDRFDPAKSDRATVRAELGIPADVPVLAVVAQITPWKGQRDAIEALALLREAQPDAHLLIVGETKFTFAATRFDNPAYLSDLRDFVVARGIGDVVHFAGERDDIPDVLAATDLLLVPSWEEPFGRTIIEGMAMAVPAIATSVGGPPEFIDDGVDGLLLAPRDPAAWAAAASELLGDPGRRAQMGERGRAKALARFSREAHVQAVLEVYRRQA